MCALHLQMGSRAVRCYIYGVSSVSYANANALSANAICLLCLTALKQVVHVFQRGHASETPKPDARSECVAEHGLSCSPLFFGKDVLVLGPLYCVRLCTLSTRRGGPANKVNNNVSKHGAKDV